MEVFEITLSSAYISEGENFTLITCESMAAEAMRSASILKDEYNLETRILNIML